ncbi:dysbindin-A-like [Littorina saxatilis]|uniref:Dysbindin-like protein n=1 Tax=Littorina saxatilis TaxID=31220 RepID=A0AAN9C039_9CAEN
MSVLKSLKGTFQNVQQDIVDSFRALTSLDTTPRHEKIKQLRAEGINLDAGADLLFRYQKDWSEMQNYTADSAKKAEEVDGMVNQIFTNYKRQWDAACQLEEEATALPTIVSTLKDMIELVGSLHQDFEAVEGELDKLLNICEEEALEREKESHVKQLAVYKKKKEAEAFAVKGKLWSMLKERAKEVDTRKSHAMKERQEAFMDAFTSDMDYYRTHGHPDRLPSATEFPKVSSLSEITIEEDKKALDEFLSAASSDPGAEDSFIEDDYTTDYSHAEEHHEDFPELDTNRPIDFDGASKDTSEKPHPDEKDSSHDSGNETVSCDSKKTEETSEETQGAAMESAVVSSDTGADENNSESKENDAAPSSADS